VKIHQAVQKNNCRLNHRRRLNYHHHHLLTDAAGERLAKRHGAATLADLRAAGADPAAFVEALRRGKMPAGYSLPQA